MAEVVEDFEWTRPYHRGDVELAALRLGMSPTALEQALRRARRLGHHVEFRKGKEWKQ